MRDLEFCDELAPEISEVNGIAEWFSESRRGTKVNFKFDITDIEEQDLNMLGVFCKCFPAMGSKSLQSSNLQGALHKYFNRLEMEYTATK